MVVYNIGIVGPEDLATKFKTQLEELNLLNVSINLSIVNQFEDTKKLELSLSKNAIYYVLWGQLVMKYIVKKLFLD